MTSTFFISIIGGLANVLLVLLLAPFFEGLLRKLTAKIQSRQGPPLWQPYYDLLKLLGKEDLESGESPVMQRFSVYLSLAATLTVACMVPMGFAVPMKDSGDVLLLIYLLTLCGISTLLAGLAAGSTYSLVGISREMMSLLTLEPLLVVALLVGATHTRSFRLDVILNGSSVYAPGHFPWSGLILLGVAIASFQALLKKIPFDTAEAETELMEGPCMEYSGPKLALLKYSQLAKLVIYSALFVALFIPGGHTPWIALNIPIFWGKVLLITLMVTVVAATHARYRIDQAIRYYAALLAISGVALLLALYGY